VAAVEQMSRVTETAAVDVAVRDVVKRFGETQVLHGVSLDILRGEFVTLLGASGCGKTTLLRILAGLERATSGHVLIRDERMDDVPPHRRPVSLVFQNLSLFPHLDVYGNVAFGLKLAHVDKREIKRLVSEYLELVSLADLAASSGARSASCRAASSSASRSRGRSSADRPCCCSTSRSPRSTRSCARRCRSS
jgi:ABC-type Fe3+/spermidine/putrescine transport system ATPase subunit